MPLVQTSQLVMRREMGPKKRMSGCLGRLGKCSIPYTSSSSLTCGKDLRFLEDMGDEVSVHNLRRERLTGSRRITIKFSDSRVGLLNAKQP